MKPFGCAKCQSKVKFKNALLLNENSMIECHNCGTMNYPRGLSNIYFKFGFFVTFLPGIMVAFYYKNLAGGLGTALLFGIGGYLLSVIYAYRKTFFSQTK